jgi:hypothetical protein
MLYVTLRKITFTSLFLLYLSLNGSGQKQWSIGISGSVDKLIDNINPDIQSNLTLNWGSSINVLVQYEFNKYLFLRTGLSYVSYAFQQNFQPGYYIYYPDSYTYLSYTEGILELPVSLGVQVPLSNSLFKLYATLGGAFGKYVYENYQNNSFDSYNNIHSSFSRNEFSFDYTAYGINLLGTVGMSYSIKPKLLIFGGLNYRQGLAGIDEFGSLGLQLGTMYYFGKNPTIKN